jgi:rhodanese-related sulfurtransferase
MTPFTQARFMQARAAGFAAALSVLMLGSAAPAQTILQATIGEPNPKTAEVSTADVQRILADGSAILLDTRKRAEYVAGHIAGAKNVAPPATAPASDMSLQSKSSSAATRARRWCSIATVRTASQQAAQRAARRRRLHQCAALSARACRCGAP